MARDETEVTVSARMPRMLLALLLMEGGRPRTAEQLIEQLWPEESPATARSAIHTYLSKIRDLLGDVLVRSPAGYALQNGAYELDAQTFARLLDEARRSPHHGRGPVTEALALWRGDPLADLQPAGPLADWTRSLMEMRFRATEIRIDCDLAAGEAADLVAELERLLTAHPYEEPFWRQLMLALYRSDRRADALGAFDRARRLLATDLGLDPSDQLKQLQLQILDQDPALLLAQSDGPSVPPRPASGHQRSARVALPHPTTRLIGRDRALLELDRLASEPACRLLTLTGLGGVGKTRLAIAHAARRAENFGDGVVFVGLARLSNAQHVRAEIAAAIARRGGDSSDPNEVSLVRYLADRELLLVLDNFEHVEEAAALVAELLEAAPRLEVLVTSRVPLRLRGEQRFEVDPLDVFGPEDPTGGPAVEMFVQGAQAVKPSHDPDPSERATIAAICSALDGLPLAIELAAARTAALSVTQIAAELETPLTIGRGALRDLPERHQTLEAAIGWSYDLLSEAGQQALRAASVFAGPFTPEALSAVVDAESTVALDELVDASLVQRSAVLGRFRLLDLVRNFARARRIEAGENDPLCARHRRRLVAQYADGPDNDFGEHNAALALERAADHADLRAAISNAVAARDQEAALTLAGALYPIWDTGQLEESGEFVEMILDAFTLSAADELELMRIADVSHAHRPNNIWSRRRAARAAELGNVRAQIGALSKLSIRALNHGDVAAAIEVSRELHQVLETHPDIPARSRGVALSALADAAYLQGDYASASALCAEAVVAARETGSARYLAIARQLQVMCTSAHERSLVASAVLQLVIDALTVRALDITSVSLLVAARYAAELAPDLACSWMVNAERVNIGIGGGMGHDWQDETVPLLGASGLATLLDSVPERPADELLVEARDWLSARDPDERVPRLEIAPPLMPVKATDVTDTASMSKLSETTHGPVA